MTLQVVDPHVHFWDMIPGNYPGLDSPGASFLGDPRPMCVPHLPADLRALADDIEILKVVHIDAIAADPLRETRWLQQLADGTGFPNAIVAYVDLSRPDAEAQLEAHAASNNLRGIRQILNVHRNPVYDYVGRNFMDEAAWLSGFALLRRFGLSFDLQLYPDQMQRAADVAAQFSDTQIVLNHAGMFADRDTPAGWRQWRDGMRFLAARGNVHVKISGLGMFDHHWTVESIRPYVHECIDAFGVERAMFASNFPVDRLFSAYATLWHAFAECVSGLSENERTRLFRSNAERFYRI